jgi:hypothetical protein
MILHCITTVSVKKYSDLYLFISFHLVARYYAAKAAQAAAGASGRVSITGNFKRITYNS